MVADNIEVHSEAIQEVTWELQELFSQKRVQLNMSVRELGAKANVSYTVIYDLEKRGILPKMDTLLKLAHALGFSIIIKQVNSSDNTPSAFGIIFHENGIEEDNISYNNLDESPKQTPKEQLRKLLNSKGLYADEITEIENYIDFKLSQH